MNKKNHLTKTFYEIHHNHLISHRVLGIILLAILFLLAIFGLYRIKAEQGVFTKVPNGNSGVCYKVGEDYTDPKNHVSCKSYQSICQTKLGNLVECKTGIDIDL